jgi:hypothetical protein
MIELYQRGGTADPGLRELCNDVRIVPERWEFIVMFI